MVPTEEEEKKSPADIVEDEPEDEEAEAEEEVKSDLCLDDCGDQRRFDEERDQRGWGGAWST